MRRKRSKEVKYLPELMRSVTQRGVAPSPSSWSLTCVRCSVVWHGVVRVKYHVVE